MPVDDSQMLAASDQALRPSRGMSALLCCVLILIPAVIDANRQYVNLTILYFIPLVMCARTFERRTVYATAILLVGLTYGIYFWKIYHYQTTVHDSIWYRLINRTMVAVCLCIAAALLGAWAKVHREFQERAANQFEADIETPIDRAVRSLRRVIVIAICMMLIAAIFLSDLRSAKQFNEPILYTLPLIVAAWAESRRLIWVLLPILLVCTWIGFYVSPPPTVKTDLQPLRLLEFLLTNRLLASFAQIGIAMMLHFWLGPRVPRRTQLAESLPPQGAAPFDA